MGTVAISGVTYEVYGDLAGANAYMNAAAHGAPWQALDSAARNQYIVTAMRVFERTSWQSTPTEPIDKDQPPAASTQPLQWPRIGLVDRNGVAVPDDSIPQDVIDGSYEYILALIDDADIQTSSVQGSNLKTDELTERVEGAVTVTTKKGYFKPTIGKEPPFPAATQQYVGLWLASSEAGLGIFAGGTDVCSESDPDYGTRNKGWP